MAFNKEKQRGKGRNKTGLGYVYFIWDRKTGRFGIYRYLIRLCHDFNIGYRKIKDSTFLEQEFVDDGRYVIAGCTLEVRGMGNNLQGYKAGIKNLYLSARRVAMEKNRLEDVQRSRFKRKARE